MFCLPLAPLQFFFSVPKTSHLSSSFSCVHQCASVGYFFYWFEQAACGLVEHSCHLVIGGLLIIQARLKTLILKCSPASWVHRELLDDHFLPLNLTSTTQAKHLPSSSLTCPLSSWKTTYLINIHERLFIKNSPFFVVPSHLLSNIAPVNKLLHNSFSSGSRATLHPEPIGLPIGTLLCFIRLLALTFQY